MPPLQCHATNDKFFLIIFPKLSALLSARVYQHNSALVTRGYPNIPRKESKTVPEGNDGSVSQQEEFGSDQPTLADMYRMFKERFDQPNRYWDSMKSHFDQLEKKLDEMVEEMRDTDGRLSGLEQDTRQTCLAMEAEGQVDTKTREHTVGATTAVQAMHGDSCSANRVDPDPMCSTSFGGDPTGPAALPCSRDDALVDNDACGAQVVSHPWRCAHQQPSVAYSPPA